jgi:lipopolysaccharide export system protein LptC
MNAAKQAAWLFIALLCLAGSGWYFASSTPPLKIDTRSLNLTSDAIILNAEVKQFNDKGQLVHLLKAQELQHIPENDTYFMLTPYIRVAENINEPAWEIRSERAKSFHGGDEITFFHQVVIHQNKTARQQESDLKTEQLVYYPKDKYATTSCRVIFQQPGTLVTSEGMHAYLEQKRVILTSRARATYEPNHA